MAVLSDNERIAVWSEFMRDAARIGNGASGLTQAQLRAAVDAVDQWCEDNASSFNSAIPQPARGALSTKQKAALLMFVVARRHDVT